MTRLIAYVRVSKTAKRTGATFQSPVEQRRAIEHIVALTPGAEIIEWIDEYDESGGTMNRPGAQAAIRAVENGTADGVVMAYLSRWARTPEALQQIEAWGRDGKMFLSAAERIDTTTSHGMFALGVLLLVAKLELDRHSETWANSTRNAIERGVAIRVPYGYQRGPDGRLQPDEPAASTVRKVFRLRAAGNGIAAIAHTLNHDGDQPPHTTHWTRQTVRAMLKVRTYLGEAKYGPNITPDAHQPLVDESTWKAAQSTPAAGWKHTDHLLTGLLRCAGCGYLMGAGSGGGGRRYSCGRVTGSGHCPSPTAAMAPRLEQFVVAAFLKRYGGPSGAGVEHAATNPELQALSRAVDDALRELETWRDDTAMRAVVGDAHYRAGMIARHRALDVAERAHARVTREESASTLRVDASLWDDLSSVEKRELLRAGVDDVLLSRAASTSTPIADRCVVRFIGEREPSDLPRQGSGRRTVR